MLRFPGKLILHARRNQIGVSAQRVPGPTSEMPVIKDVHVEAYACKIYRTDGGDCASSAVIPHPLLIVAAVPRRMAGARSGALARDCAEDQRTWR